ncbi:hypothetical protein CXQ84_14160 [Burkholderia pseudomallei]|nr:hypothetical protein CXQ84_14160 [Burkholderia pseudomallei]
MRLGAVGPHGPRRIACGVARRGAARARQTSCARRRAFGPARTGHASVDARRMRAPGPPAHFVGGPSRRKPATSHVTPHAEYGMPHAVLSVHRLADR